VGELENIRETSKTQLPVTLLANNDGNKPVVQTKRDTRRDSDALKKVVLAARASGTYDEAALAALQQLISTLGGVLATEAYLAGATYSDDQEVKWRVIVEALATPSRDAYDAVCKRMWSRDLAVVLADGDSVGKLLRERAANRAAGEAAIAALGAIAFGVEQGALRSPLDLARAEALIQGRAGLPDLETIRLLLKLPAELRKTHEVVLARTAWREDLVTSLRRMEKALAMPQSVIAAIKTVRAAREAGTETSPQALAALRQLLALYNRDAQRVEAALAETGETLGLDATRVVDVPKASIEVYKLALTQLQAADKKPTQKQQEQRMQLAMTPPERRKYDLLKQLEANFETNAPKAKEIATTLASEFPEQYTGTWLVEVAKKIDDAVRIRGLVDTLKSQFSTQAAAAKATATQLATDYPELFTKEWLDGIKAKIDVAVKQRKVGEEIQRCLATAKAEWDRRPEPAKTALRRALQLAPRDLELRGWATRFIAQIDDFQDNQIMANFDRPTPAKEAAERFHRRNPRRFSAANLAEFNRKVDSYQDQAWANRVGEAEVRAWLGANVFEYVEEAPDEVKRELMIQLGRMKRDQLLGAGGGGVRSKVQLANPVSEQQRMDVLDRSDDVSTTFTFSTSEQLVPKTMERTANQLDTEATKLRDDKTPVSTDGNLFSSTQTPAITTITNAALDGRADDMQRSATAYRDLATRLRTGQTTIAAERDKMELDRQALNWEAIKIRDSIPDLQKAGSIKEVEEAQRRFEELCKSSQYLQDILATPTGVVPNAGVIATQLKYERKEKAFVAGSTESSWVGSWMNLVDRVTVGDDPYSQGVGRNFNEMLVGLTRGLGRIPAFEAGVLRFLADCGERWFPESMTAALRQQAESNLRMATAMQGSQSSVTWENTKARDTYTAAGGKIPLLDRAFNNEMIFSKPDVAAMTVLSNLPPTPVTAGIQVAIAVGQTFESFFSTYGRTGSIQASLTEAGWTTFQNVVGVVFSKFGLGAELAGNVAVVYGVGKARGLSNEQIEEEIAWMVVSIGATKLSERVGSRPSLRATTREVISKLEGKPLELDPATRAVDAKVDAIGVKLETALVTERALVEKIRAGQSKGLDVTTLFKELQLAAFETSQQREALRAGFREQPTTTGTVDATVPTTKVETPVIAEATTAKTETATVDTQLVERDRKFRSLFDDSIPAADSLPERTVKGLERLASEARTKYPELAKLTDTEVMALIGYTTSDAARINQGLRGQRSEVANAAAKDYAAVINDALAKLPEQPGTFTRMVEYDATILAQFVEGGFVREPGFSSTSMLDKGSLGKQSIGGNTELVVNGKRGKRIDFLSAKPGEVEVLFPADALFRVDSVETKGGTTKIVLTEVDAATGSVQVIGRPSKAVEASRPTETVAPTETVTPKSEPSNTPTQPTFKPEAANEGLGADKRMAAFSDRTRSLESSWKSLDEGARLDKLRTAINQQLADAGVPPLEVVSVTTLGTANGSLDFPTWAIHINSERLGGALSADQFAALMNTVYHEARHGEQWYSAARYLHAQGLRPSHIHALTGIPMTIIDTVPINTRPMTVAQMSDAKAYFDSVYGVRSSARNATFSESATNALARKLATLTIDSLEANPNTTPANLAAAKTHLNDLLGRGEILYETYRQLPEEVDAFATGLRLQTTLEARRTFIGRMGNNVELFIAQAREWLEVALRIKSMPELAQTHVAVDQQIAQVQQWLAVLHDKLVERKNAITSDTPLATEQLQQLNAQIQQVLALETQYTVAPTP